MAAWAIAVVFGQDGFAKIAVALAQVQIGGYVYVANGLCAEDFFAIARPVSIFSEQAGVDGRTRNAADMDETVIVPGIQQPGLTLDSNGYPVIDIFSDGVSIDGLIVDADHPALISAAALNGANPDVSDGIYVQRNDFKALNSAFSKYHLCWNQWLRIPRHQQRRRPHPAWSLRQYHRALELGQDQLTGAANRALLVILGVRMSRCAVLNSTWLKPSLLNA